MMDKRNQPRMVQGHPARYTPLAALQHVLARLDAGKLGVEGDYE